MLVSQKDYYSPLPSELTLRRTRNRWTRPSALQGVRYDLSAMEARFSELCEGYLAEFASLPTYDALWQKSFSPGFPLVDAFTLYSMVRSTKPARYLEVGSGLSTYYCQLAGERNVREGCPVEITCIEPNPYQALKQLPGLRVIQSEVQDVSADIFRFLQAGDILFIDSSHILRIGSDVPFLYLEILPILASGVYVHVHDVPFPYNVPYPPEYWTLLEHPDSPHWPMYWNEAMFVQAFLAFNDHFEILHSVPLLRHYDEPFLSSRLPFYQPISVQPNTFSSLWLRRTSRPESPH
ncbi:MAG TPA: class I SAM-dependent methyltransferase [Verrucomicrobiae bacterium]|nr:class I SAM-dependent methyltransferase [Verrucomicrobiae bacterium]